MKIGINVCWMTPGVAGGMEWYARGLIEHLARLDTANEYLLVVGPMNYKTFHKPGPNWKLILYEGAESTPQAFLYANPDAQSLPQNALVRFTRDVYARVRSVYRSSRVPVWRGTLPELIKSHGLDIWFCPFMYTLPINTDVPVVNTIPDLQHEYYPGLFDNRELGFRTLGYQYSCMAATATIGISQATAQDIISLYAIDSKKVFAIPLSLDPLFDVSSEKRSQCVQNAKTKFGLNTDYIYFPANGWPHKNHATLVKAIHQVRDRGHHLDLVFTGAPFDLMNRMKALLDRYALHDHVRHLGYVDREDVIGLYGGSKMLAFPSTFEGFGIPLLEAMALGTPVVCSNVTSLPEVGGQAALYFDPKNPESIADAIVKVATDETLRDEMVRAGKQRVQQFSYDHVAKQTYEIFDKIYSKKLSRPSLAPPRGLGDLNRLLDGHSRWYFHCPDLKKIRLIIAPEPALSKKDDQHVKIFLNEQLIIETALRSAKHGELALRPKHRVPDGFYRLDIFAKITRRLGNQILSARVLRLEAENLEGRVIRLMQ